MTIDIYVEDGREITTHSMIKTFRRCPKQMEYKYIERLKPRSDSKPLTQGTWMHRLMQALYDPNDISWQEAHAELSKKYWRLFDEERDELGDLPNECLRMMRSYLWHYEDCPWKVLEVEQTLETEFPDGSLYRARIDLLVEDQYGLWIVDHKFNKTLPNLGFRLLDAASALYVWAARRSGIPVQGFIWNYMRRKAPSIPALVASGTRLSKRACDTDYPTLLRAIKEYDLDPKPYYPWLRRLKDQKFQHGGPQMSSYFLRSVLERDDEVLKRVAREGFHTSKRFRAYEWEKTGSVERVPDRSCTFMCSYTDICQLELFGGNTVALRGQRYKQVDPMYYYHDDPAVDKINVRGDD